MTLGFRSEGVEADCGFSAGWRFGARFAGARVIIPSAWACSAYAKSKDAS